ncbi:tRNA (adenosine(37)-N6)-dimethylallyltransferase MiaA [soil metagenome]
MQIYRDLQVISARPTESEEAGAPHHLYGVADASEAWSVGRWLRAAVPILDGIARKGRPAIVVGGTGLYFRAPTEGLADLPAPAPQVPLVAAQTFDEVGEADFRIALAQVDPEAEARIMAGDKQRLVRAYSVFWGTGRSLTQWQALTSPTLAPGSWTGVVIEPPRDQLYARVDARARTMLQTGALQEAMRLGARNLDPELPAMKAVGLQAFIAAAEGRIASADALERVAQDSRRYAKRQLTWLRNQTPEWSRIETLEPQGQIAALFAILGVSA